MSLNERFDALMRQHELLFGKSLVPMVRLNPSPLNPIKCFKCQGLGHTSLDYPNKKIITLAEWEVAMEEENKEKK